MDREAIREKGTTILKTAEIFDLQGKTTEKITLPNIFSTPLRPDVIKRAVLAIQSSRIQPQGKMKRSIPNRYSFLKETFCDPGELLRLEWREIKGNVISIAHPVKGHLPGQMEVSGRLLAMLNALPKDSKLVFPTTYKNIAETFRIVRKRAAQKLANPNLLEISFKSYRHWGGSMLAHVTNGNILTIKKLLRHKRIENTMKYIHTIQFRDEDYEISTATTEEEIKQLGKAGFIKYDEMSGIHFYRKPKRFRGSA
jgi:integrase